MKSITLLLCFITSRAFALDLPANTDYTPSFWWYVTLASQVSTPDTPDQLKEGSKCPECEGDGILEGDGTPEARKKCHHCKGDGICHKDDPILTGNYSDCPHCGNDDNELEVIEDPPVPEIATPPVTAQQIEVEYFTYNGERYIYREEFDRFITFSGKKMKPSGDWRTTGSINVCSYNSQGVKVSCENCPIRTMTVSEPPPFVPREDISDEPTSAYATPPDIVERIVNNLPLNQNKTFLDVGSGDGRMVIAAALRYGCRAIGIEQDPNRIALARENASRAGVSDRVTFIQGDFSKLSWPQADVVYAYLFPEDLSVIRSKLIKSNYVVSFAHKVPNLSMTNHNDGEFYSWKPEPSVVGVMYHGHFYTHPVCNLRNCPMCNAIRAGLRAQGVIL